MARGHATMSRYTYSTTVEVDVDIDESDLSDDDLMEMCELRGLLSGGLNKDLMDILYAHFKLGQTDAVLAKVRQVIMDRKGVVL